MTDDRGGDQPRAQPALIVACPTCRKSIPFSTDNPDRPFCSERCRLIDLGAWAEGRHHIPGDPDWMDEGEEQD
ncbi:MAG TPA: DNA gyrase inhibitor YacG [Pseudomonadales bacterium]|nr:DNA gyrase inhibitor YacG [Pseudomonadales bacterium]